MNSQLTIKLSRIITELFKQARIPCDDGAFVTAISGGADSSALLDLMVQLRNDCFFHLAAAHFNHQLRPASDDEERRVEQFCAELQVPLFKGRADVAAAAESSGLSLHAAARAERYAFLVRTANQFARSVKAKHPPVLLIAHHLDDQIETILMRLFAGSSVEGLAGMRPVSEWTPPEGKVMVLRPLLRLRRRELEAYCSERGIGYAQDESNLERRWPRSRVRLDLMPLLERVFGASAALSAHRTAAALGEAADFISAEIDRSFRQAVIKRRPGELELDYELYKSYLTLIRSGCLQRAARSLDPSAARLSRRQLQLADRRLQDGSRGKFQLGGGIIIAVGRDRIFIYKSHRPNWHIRLEGEGTVNVPGWGRLALSVGSAEPSNLKDATCVVLDAAKLNLSELHISPARPGERMMPLGSKFRCHLADLLRDAGVPSHRRSWPAVRYGGEVIALPPMRIADRFKVTPDTREFLLIRWLDDNWLY